MRHTQTELLREDNLEWCWIMLPVLLALPDSERVAEIVSLWRELRARAMPFPIETGDEEPETKYLPCCDPPNFASSTILRHLPKARICFSNRFFALGHETQLGVLLHEVVHIRLFRGRLSRSFQSSRDAEDDERAREYSGDKDEADFGVARWKVANGLLLLVHEIGVDRFMSGSRYGWLSNDYWADRAHHFYLSDSLLSDELTSPSMVAYVAFYRLVAAELGLAVLPDIPERRAVEERQIQRAEALAEACEDDETRDWLDSVRCQLLEIDVSANEPDACSYDEVFKRVIELTD